MGYLYEQLTDRTFQEFCQALLAAIFPGVRCLPVGQPDGGRDAALPREGTIFQVKWTEYPDRVADPVRWLARTVAGERQKIARLHARGARRYILMTNVRGTAALETGQIDRLDAALAKMLAELPGLEIAVWWRDTLDRHFENNPGLQWTYKEILPGRQAAGMALAEVVRQSPAGDAAAHLLASGVPVGAASPRLLGVHPAATGPDASDRLSAYVARDVDRRLDSELAAARQAGAFIVLVGGPCSGKTRTAYEAIRRAMPDWSLVHPEDGGEVRALLSVPPRPTVVWLDEIQYHLSGTDGITGSTVRGLLNWAAPVVIIGTIWPDALQRYQLAPAESRYPGGREPEDPYRRERAVLKLPASWNSRPACRRQSGRERRPWERKIHRSADCFAQITASRRHWPGHRN